MGATEVADVTTTKAIRTKPRAAGQRDPARTRTAILDAATQEFTAKGLTTDQALWLIGQELLALLLGTETTP